jgi:purine-binding chemotaxis protein CheW
MNVSKQDDNGPVDWKKVKSRMNSTSARMDEERNLSAAEKLRILRARTKDLAAITRVDEQIEDGLEVILFRLADETYGIERNCITEVYPLTDVTPLPCTPAYVVGLINVRGEIKTLIDIRKFFNLPEKGLSEHSRVILVETHAMEAGILADDILGISSLSRKDIQTFLASLTDKRAEYTKGVSTGQVVILDIDRILSDEKIIVDESVE